MLRDCSVTNGATLFCLVHEKTVKITAVGGSPIYAQGCLSKCHDNDDDDPFKIELKSIQTWDPQQPDFEVHILDSVLSLANDRDSDDCMSSVSDPIDAPIQWAFFLKSECGWDIDIGVTIVALSLNERQRLQLQDGQEPHPLERDDKPPITFTDMYIRGRLL